MDTDKKKMIKRGKGASGMLPFKVKILFGEAVAELNHVGWFLASRLELKSEALN